MDMLIGCIPKWASPSPPPDQKGCVEEDCPQCGEVMWVSEKKRAIREAKPETPCMCMVCLVNEMGDEPPVMVDIAKL